MTLTDQDLQQLKERGISPAQVQEQFERLRAGIPYADLRSAATPENGIVVLSESEKNHCKRHFEDTKNTLDLLKFTPASGAATRMFKFLFQFLEEYDLERDTINAYINKNKVPALRLFFIGIDGFPFYAKVRKRLKKKFKKKESIDINKNRVRFVKIMLDEDALDFGKRPKGLFPFHSYKHHVATAFEEHLFEASAYASNDGVARLHFTISEEHLPLFKRQYQKRKEYIKRKTNTDFDISYSYQSATTDTIAITSDNILLREKEGCIVFRPGGHGALINNLNEQHADIIFIKNVDNVVVHKYKDEVATHKKILAGKLLQLQEKAFDFMNRIDASSIDGAFDTFEVATFLQNELSVKLARDYEKYSPSYQLEYLRELLDRPIRVCGMVKNEGEPGGGPFWVRQESGKESLQIVESVQINPESKRQQDILKSATHFNPVDIVCGVKNYKGEKYNLLDYVDYKAGFITTKSHQGLQIRALEHPGLWNGGMAHWNTVFVEVPLATFNPVKTVNDLLKPAHQVKK